MEYAGEVIRRPVAGEGHEIHACLRMHMFRCVSSTLPCTDKREQQYSQQGLGLYFFALDKDHYIDATYKGNIARYINHSCR